MKKDDALKEITNIGIAYFQDWISDFENINSALESIIQEIKDHASGSKPTGSGSWEAQEEAFRFAAQELKTDELDRILEFEYGFKPEAVGGSKPFFQRLHTAIFEGIAEARRRNSLK